MSATICASSERRFAYILTVLTILLQRTHGQSYLLTVGQNHRQFYGDETSHETYPGPPLYARLNYTNTPAVAVDSHEDFDNNNNNNHNKTIIVIKSIREDSNELSQTAMDIITVVWYVATFLALAAFFMLMACSDRRCNDAQRAAINANASEAAMPPPTPSPSYSEFAPPSYDSVIKMQHAAKPSVFVIAFAENKDSNTGNDQTPTTPTTPAINFYTVNELQGKVGS